MPATAKKKSAKKAIIPIEATRARIRRERKLAAQTLGKTTVPGGTQYLSLRTFTSRIGVCNRTGRRMVHNGQVGFVRLPNGYIRIPESEVSRLMTSLFIPATAPAFKEGV